MQPLPPTGDPQGADDLVDALVQSSFATMAVLTRVAGDHDLSLTQLRVLGILRDRRLRMSDLADYLGLERSTLSGLVDRAEKRGLLSRGPSPDDRRAVEVSLSQEGSRLAERLTAVVAQAIAPLLRELTAAEQARLRALLSRTLASPSPVDGRP